MYHNAAPDNPKRGNILVWEQPLDDRLQGKPLGLDDVDARMDAQSILYRTLWLFGATFAAVAVTFGVVIWWILRRGGSREAHMFEGPHRGTGWECRSGPLASAPSLQEKAGHMTDGATISIQDGKLQVPDHPIIPFIEGDGTGPDIWRASVRVFDAAVAKAYGGSAQDRLEGGAGRPAFLRRDEELAARRDRRRVQGVPGRHQRSADDAGRRRHALAERGLAADARSVRLPAAGALVQGRASPVKTPEKVDMVIFRENTEDIYAGIEWEAGSDGARKVLAFLKQEFPKSYERVRFPERARIGIKPVSQEGTERLDPVGDRVRARQQAQEPDDRAQGQHHEVHRGRIPRLGLRAGRARVRAIRPTPGSSGGGPKRPAAKRPPTPNRRRRSRPASCSSRTPSPTSRCSRC